MLKANFQATDDADWAVALALTNDATNEPLEETDDGVFNLEVSDCGTAVLTATSEDLTITKPETGTIQWRFSAAQMASLYPGKTYAVGLTMTSPDETVTQIMVGSLAIIDGGF